MENFIPETWKILSRKPGKYYPGNLENIIPETWKETNVNKDWINRKRLRIPF